MRSLLAPLKEKSSRKQSADGLGWTGVAFIVGPLVGGLLVDLFSWRLVFAINVIPIIIALFFASKLSVSETTKERTRFDTLGATLGAVGLGGLVFALIEQGNLSWANPLIWVSFAIGLLSLAGFVLHERRTAQPMLPLSLFQEQNFSVGSIATFMVYAALSLQGFLLVIFLQQLANYSATFAGLASLPVTVLMLILSSKFGALSGKYGPRLFMALGPIISGLGTLYLSSVTLPANYWAEVLPGTVLFGLGISMTVAPLTSAILSSISSSRAGVGSAVNNAVSRIAGLLAVAVLGIFIGTSITLSGFQIGMIICSILLILGGIISAIGISNKTVHIVTN